MDKAEALFNDKVDGNVVGPSTDSSGSELIYLCYNGNFQTIQLLIKSNQQLLLDKACGGIGDCPKVEHKPTWKKLQEVLLRKHETYTVGDLLLCVACILQNQTLVELLTNRGVDVNHGTTKHELLSPLYIACINEDIEMITYLMNNKAEVISVIAKEFPTLISQVLEKRIEEYKVPRRKGKMKNSQKKKTMYRLCWENSHLHALNKDWFMVEKYNITRVELPRNKLTKLVDGFFQLLPLLEELDVASNHLMALPSDHLANSKLKRLDVSSNQLRSLPESLFFNQNIVVIDASSNQLSSLPHTHTNWKCSALEKFVCSKNELTELPKSIAGANRIQILNLSRNKFEVFNRWWKCPLVDVNLSFNHIKDFTLKTDSFWSKTIKTLNLTRNNLDFIPSSILHLTKLENLKLARNALKTLPRPDLWKTKRLLDLDLSYNQITTTPITDGFLDLETEEVEYNNTCELPVKIFADTLQSLNLAHNLLDEIPETLCQLKALGRLDLSHNTGLTFLPPKLGLLKNIWSLNLSGLDIKNVPHKFEGLNHVKVLSFLRAKLRKSKPFNRIKLMLVGLQGRGKTTLVHAIQGKPPPPNISTVGIIVEQFVLPLRNQYYFYSSPSPEIMFSVWDLAGQQVYYATHQCFLSGKTLYLVVYNVTHGSEGIDSLGSWLLNIQARAPNSRCIIVGTHVDKMPVYRKEETLIKYRKQIMDKFMKEGFPAISKCVFVSGTSNENIEELREVVYKEAEAMNHQSDLGKLAPISYLELYDQIMMESVRRKEQQRPPVLTTEEMLQLAEQNTNNDIMDFEELCTASQFLHENGVLLHFNDHLRGLNNLFFIEPSWLIDTVALVVTIRQRNPYVQKGYITEQELLYILKNPWLPEKFIPQYLRLLERFEILLSLEDGKFLIPCMLSEEKPDIEHKMLHVITSEEIRHHQINVERTTNYLTRNYHMQYVPAGFWARLIARLVIAVQKWSLQIQQDGNTGYTKQLWRKGLMVTYEDGYFLIESFHDQELRPKKWSNQGVSITVWSKTKDFSVMGFIVDHMEMLITEWYPGLEGINDYGDNLVQKLISCPICCAQKAIDLVQCCDQNTISLRNHYGSFFRNEFFINQFPLDTCAYAAIDHQEIICVKHPDQPVRLELLIPEIMMTDLPQKYCITEDSLDFDPHTSRKLGDGGAGVVYLGRYDDEDVAIKRSHSVIMKESADKLRNSELTNQQGEGAFDPSDRSVTQLLSLDDGRVVKSFWEMRQEVLVLCTLQHANIVKFLGVCFSPLCFVIEFAPMGSLFGILEKEQKKAELPILGMQLTYLILFQITEAIKYLHSWNIIYRDLKSENVLVMSLDPQQTINVKLSDYGIAAFATPQGVTGVAGTPAFQAPEIQKDYTYDEKVDIFSYGIWMYELLTGCLPYLEYRSSSEIKKAIQTGVRPDFRKEGYRLSYPYAELLMNECWQQSPPSRPSSYEMSAFFKSTDMMTLRALYPSNQDSIYLEHVTCHTIWHTNFPDTMQCDPSDKILLWNNKKENRTFVLFDLKCHTIRYNDSLPGPRVSCACQVEENVWLGCETNRVIEIFGFVNSEVPKVLWTFSDFEDDILMMQKHESEGILTVFTTLANGTLVIFTKMVHHRKSELIEEEDLWSRQVINLQTRGRPAKCMTITNNQTELWVGSGNCIVVLNIQTREIVDRLAVTKMSDQNALISVMCGDGEDTVWTSLWKSGFVTQWNVKERTKTFEYYCSEDKPLHKGVRYECGTFKNLFRQPTIEERDLKVKVQSPICEEMKTFRSNNNRLAEDTLYKRPSLRFPTRTYVRHKSSTASTSSTLDELTSNSTSKRNNMFNKTVTALRFVKGILWIGRTNGDVIVIDHVTGHVTGVLADDHLKLLGNDNRYIQSMVPMEKDSKMTACVRIRNEARGRRSLVPNLSLERKQKECYQILVYDIWSSGQLNHFNDKVQEIFNE